MLAYFPARTASLVSFREYECSSGRFVAVIVLDLLAFLATGAYAALAFFYVRGGKFAIEVQGDQAVDYFGEAERYFPDNADDDKASLYE